MKFSGYWVSIENNKATLERTTFDETDLDPATNWKQAWQNQDLSTKGFVDLPTALTYAAQALASTSGHSLSQADADKASKFKPAWTAGDNYEIHALSQLLIPI